MSTVFAIEGSSFGVLWARFVQGCAALAGRMRVNLPVTKFLKRGRRCTELFWVGDEHVRDCQQG